MPTYTFSRTREQIRDIVLRKLGALAAGETADANDAELIYEALDLRIKELHAMGVLWFKVAGALSDVTITSGAATTNAASDVLYPVTFQIRDGTEDFDVRIVSHLEFQSIVDKTDTGRPEVVLYSGGVYRFWPVPDANYTGKLTYQQIGADTVAATAPDVQVAMMRSLCALIVSDVADEFGMPEQKIMRIRAESEMAERRIKALTALRVDSSTTQAEYF